jgi:phosphate:Na+ symporter
MSEGTQHLRSYQPFIDAMRNLDNRFLGILIGTVFTAVIQSSSATTGVVIMLCANGLLNLEPAISLVIGANIGTCVTAILSAIGKPRASLQVAMAHVLFKSIGALAWVAFIPHLGHVVEWITPSDIGRQVANAHTIFNVVNALVMIWFTAPFSKFVKFIVPDKANQTNRVLPNLDPYYLEHSGVSLDLVFEAIKKTGEKVLNIARTGFEAAMYGNEKKIEQLRKSDEEIDAAYAEIIVFVQSIQQNKLLPQEVRKLNNLTEAANVLETVADLISTNLADSADHRIERQIVLEKETVDELKELYNIALDAFNRAFLEYSEAKPMNHWEEEKNQFKDQVAKVRSRLIIKLSEEQPNQIEKYKLATEVIEVSRQLHAMARRLARKIN